jgi:hypothetical protein
MTTLIPSPPIYSITAAEVKFENQWLKITLNNGQVIHLALQEIPWLKWLAQATLEQKSNWSLEPGGYAIYWDDLDDGIEICHLMTDRSFLETTDLSKIQPIL